MHLASHAQTVVATDTNPRALALAAATARLNDQTWDLRLGSLYDPVQHERDLADHSPGPDHVEHHDVPGLRADLDGEPSGLDDVEAVAEVALGEQALSLREVARAARVEHA